jgi:hypothetical protein
MRPRFRRQSTAHGRHEPYGDRAGRNEHRAVRTGHNLRPQYGRKLLRMITRLFR